MPKLFRKDTPRKLFTKRRIAIVGGVILGIALLWGVYAYLVSQINQHPNAAFVIEGVQYERDEVEKLIEAPVSAGMSKNDAAKSLFEMYKLEAAAEKLDLALTDDEIAAVRVVMYPDEDMLLNDWQKLLVRDQAYKNHLSLVSLDYPEVEATGYVYVFYFGSHIERGDNYESPQYGNQALIAKDREYAKSQAEKYHKQLTDGEIDPKELFERVKADEKLNHASNPTISMSHRIGGDAIPFAAIPLESARERAYELVGQQGVSSLEMGTVNTNYTTEEKDKVETYYFFVYIDKAAGISGWSKLQDTVDSLQAEYRGLPS